ncbi:hypothetical protein Aduo_019516 [Ancylostoma duodenale]
MSLITKTTDEVLEELPDLTTLEKKMLRDKGIDGWYLFNNLSVDRLQKHLELDELIAEYIVDVFAAHASYDVFPEKFATPLEEALKPDFEKEKEWEKQAKQIDDWVAVHEEKDQATDDCVQ